MVNPRFLNLKTLLPLLRTFWSPSKGKKNVSQISSQVKMRTTHAETVHSAQKEFFVKTLFSVSFDYMVRWWRVRCHFFEGKNVQFMVQLFKGGNISLCLLRQSPERSILRWFPSCWTGRLLLSEFLRFLCQESVLLAVSGHEGLVSGSEAGEIRYKAMPLICVGIWVVCLLAFYMQY